MSDYSAIEIGALSALLLGIVLAWDGLVRRHVRLSVWLYGLRIDWPGYRAQAAGVLGLGLVAAGWWISLPLMQWIVSRCGGAASCVGHTLLGLPLVDWRPALAFVLVVGLFAVWVSGAGDLKGPYRRQLLAPGVWESEKELLRQVEQRLHTAGQQTPSQDTILALAQWVKSTRVLLMLHSRRQFVQNGRPINAALVRTLLQSREISRFGVPDSQLPIVVEVICDYYRDLARRAAMAYPWRRKRLERASD